MPQWKWTLPLALMGVMVLITPLPARSGAPADHLIRIEASQYAYEPGVIHVQRGDTVTLELVSTDVVHGLYVDEYGVSTTADPGQSERLTFKADRAGSFRFRCNTTCGAMHPFMIGRLIVDGNGWLWRALGLTSLAALWIMMRPRLKT